MQFVILILLLMKDNGKVMENYEKIKDILKSHTFLYVPHRGLARFLGMYIEGWLCV